MNEQRARTLRGHCAADAFEAEPSSSGRGSAPGVSWPVAGHTGGQVAVGLISTGRRSLVRVAALGLLLSAFHGEPARTHDTSPDVDRVPLLFGGVVVGEECPKSW